MSRTPSGNNGRRKDPKLKLWNSIVKLHGEEKALALENLGRLSFEEGDYPAAAIFAEEAAELWLNLGYEINAVTAMSNAGAAWKESNYLEESKLILTRARDVLDQNGLLDANSLNREILGHRFASLMEYSSAKRQIERVIMIEKDKEDFHRLAHLFQFLSYLDYKLGNHDESYRTINEALIALRKCSFQKCCIDILLQWLDLSIVMNDVDDIQQAIEDSIKIVTDNFGSSAAQALKLKKVKVLNLNKNFESAFNEIEKIEIESTKMKNVRLNAEFFFERAICTNGMRLSSEYHESISRARSRALAESNIELLVEIDKFEVLNLIYEEKIEDAQKLLNELGDNSWYSGKAKAKRNLALLRSMLFLETYQLDECRELVDALLLMELEQNELLQVLSIRAQVVLESENINLARVLIGKAREIAHSGQSVFAKQVFFVWSMLNTKLGTEFSIEESHEMVKIYLSGDRIELKQKTARVFESTFS